MVMAVTTRSKTFEDVVFQEREPFKGKGPQDWQEEESFKQQKQSKQKEEKLQEPPQEVTTALDPSWSTK